MSKVEVSQRSRSQGLICLSQKVSHDWWTDGRAVFKLGDNVVPTFDDFSFLSYQPRWHTTIRWPLIFQWCTFSIACVPGRGRWRLVEYGVETGVLEFINRISRLSVVSRPLMRKNIWFPGSQILKYLVNST